MHGGIVLQKLKTKKNKYLSLFVKKSIKYFTILYFIIALTIPLVLTSYHLVREKTINNSYNKLVEGFHTLETQIMNLQGISDILMNDSDFSQLLLLKGLPQSENYMHINAVQTKLRKLCIEQEFISNVYIIFKNNPIFISNYISADDYKNVYPHFFNYEDQPVREWYGTFFTEKYIMKFLPQRHVYSKYYSSNYFDAVTCMINNSNYRAINLTSSIACTIDSKNLLNSMLDKDIVENGFAYIVDSEGNMIFRHNYKYEHQLENILNFEEINFQSKKYLMLTNKSTKLGLCSVAGIPVNIFRKNIASMISLVLLYSIIGICVILIVSLCFSAKETISMKRLIDVAFNTSNITFNNKNNEYSYINNVIQQIGSVNVQQSERINTLNNSIKALILENLFTLGVYSKKEENEIISYFNNKFQMFCVVKLQFLGNSDKSLEQSLSLEIENALKTAINNQYVLLNFHHDEIIFVIFFDETNNKDVEILRRRLKEKLNEVILLLSSNMQSCPIINMGMSMIVSGVRKARDAYIQASYAINTNRNSEESGVYLYNTPRSFYNRKIFDIGELLKIYNSILSGDETLVNQIFKEIYKCITKCYLNEQEQLQVFFTLRQTVYTAYIEIINGYMENTREKVPAFPEYIPDKDFERQFNVLVKFSISLCDLIAANKKSKNEKLKTEIINYIQMNYYNINLTAANIAEEMLLSEKYVFSFIKEQTGKSLGQYIEDIRVSKAEEYLVNTEYTNKKIAQICGFGSENTFYRTFSKKHGLSPKIWRKIHKK
jgi:AraC-like DNA-binding protein